MEPKLKLLLTVATGLLVASCNNNNTTNKQTDTSSADSNKEMKIKQESSSDEDTIFKDKDVFVLGNKSDRGEDAVSYVGVRFKPHVHFSDFPAAIGNNTFKARIQYSSNPLAKQFRTRITETYNKGINFGGHYTFAEWGCGSPCQMSVVVDDNTGIVYDGMDGTAGYEFSKNSRMLIVNPPDSDGFYLINVEYMEPLIYVWNEKSKKFQQR